LTNKRSEFGVGIFTAVIKEFRLFFNSGRFSLVTFWRLSRHAGIGQNKVTV
jgi:hypothetical protein